MDGDITLSKDWLEAYPEEVRAALGELVVSHGEVYVTGGAVRDWLCSVMADDLDISVAGDGIAAARYFADRTGGAFVLLDEEEGVARVVVNGLPVDISSFREGTTDIVADLQRRDFSINAMAVAVGAAGSLVEPYRVIDPLGGVADVGRDLVRAPSPDVFDNDPLRLLRAYRFAAHLGFGIDGRTVDWIKEKNRLVTEPAPERIRYELDKIMRSRQASASFRQMHESGLLGRLFPELVMGEGLDQPASHHLDVLEHNLAALAAMEEIIDAPGDHFPGHRETFLEYLAMPARPMLIKWAALFHDLGKPDTHEIRDDGRATFYNHDRAGAGIFDIIAERLRWNRDGQKIVNTLISHHMYPFHLCNAEKRTGISAKACLRLVKAAGGELPGLFLLAMADSHASQGPLRPPDMENTLAELFTRVDRVYEESIKPVLAAPLLNGRDLIELGLEPGPVFGEILDEVEQAQVAGEVADREGALRLARRYLDSGES